MTKPLVYVHRLGPWYTRYMDEDNEALLGSFAEIVSGGAREAPLSPEELIAADVLSFHLPVTDETRRMFGARELGWIKDGAVFVNSARNAIFDDAALVAEICRQRFSAFLDVFEVEPLPLDHPYRTLPNVFITPHIAGDNMVMFRRCGRQAIEALREALASSGS